MAHFDKLSWPIIETPLRLLLRASEHPFYVIEPTPRVLAESEAWQPLPQTAGRWVDAGALTVGDHVWRADGSTGVVESVEVVAVPQRMYNLTVDVAHTFFVGHGAWLVHNAGPCNLPSRGGKGPTSGHLTNSDGDVIGDIIISGNNRSLPAAKRSMIRNSEGLPSNVDILHHVEFKTARYMQENGISDATLVLNNHPCSGAMSCSKWLSNILPEGSTLRVIVPDGLDARGAFDFTFTGQ